jgi:predicted membrane protein
MILRITMNKYMHFKKIWGLIVSLLPPLLLILVWSLGSERLCGVGLCSREFIYYIKPLFYPLSALTALAFIAFCFREEIFIAWFKFALGWTALTILLIFNSSTHRTGGGMFYSDRELISFLFPAIFVLVSAGIIIWKSFSLRKKQKNR